MEQQQPQLSHYLRLLWGGKWLILLTTLVAFGGVLAFSKPAAAPTPSYEAIATVKVVQRPDPSGLDLLLSPGAPDKGLNTQILLIKSRNVMERAVGKLRSSQGEGATTISAAQVEALRGAITVLSVPSTNLLEVRAKASTPELAERRANAVVEAYVDYLKAERSRAIEEALLEVDAQLNNPRALAQLGAEVASLLPHLGSQLADITQRLEQQAEALAQLQKQVTPSDAESVRQLEVPKLQAVVADLDRMSRDLQQLQEKLKVEQPQEARGGQSPLSLQAPRMEAAAADLDTIAQELELLRDGMKYTQRRRLNDSQTESLIYDALTEILDRVRGSGENLRTVSKDLQIAGGGPDSSGEPALAARAGSRTFNIILNLDVASRQLQAVARGGFVPANDGATPEHVVIDPLLAAQLNAIEARLNIVRRAVEDVSLRLDVTAQGGDTTLADGLGAIRARLQESAEILLIIRDNIQSRSEAPGVSMDALGGLQPHDEAARIVVSLGIASRQLQALQRRNVDPLVEGELGSLSERLTKAQGDAKGISERLAIFNANASALGTAGNLAMAQHQLNAAAGILSAASQEARQYSGELTSESIFDTTSRIKDQADIGVAILDRVIENLSKLQSGETDALRFGQIVLVKNRTSDASEQAKGISVQLGEYLSAEGPKNQELIQLRHKLELSQLVPQETGITIVDSAVSARAPDKSRSFTPFISRLRLPLSALAGMLLGSMAVLFREQMDQTVRTHRRLRDQLGLATLGIVPKGKAPGNPHPPMVSAQDPSEFSEALQLVGAAVIDHLANGTGSFLVTSATAKEGKTMLAVNLAQVLAQYGYRVLLVDGNLRKPEIAKVLYLPEEEGISSALAERRNPADYILPAGDFAVLPGGKPVSNPVETLASPPMKDFLNHARQLYDVVLVDGPPVMGFAETKVLAKEVGGVILVVRAGATSAAAVKEIKGDLEGAGIPLVGAVLNFASAEECGHLRHKQYGPPNATKNGKKAWLSRKLPILFLDLGRIWRPQRVFLKDATKTR